MPRGTCILIVLIGTLWLMPGAAPASGKPAVDTTSPGSKQADAVRELVLQRKFLNLPVQNGAPKRRMSVTID